MALLNQVGIELQCLCLMEISRGWAVRMLMGKDEMWDGGWAIVVGSERLPRFLMTHIS